MSEHFSFECRTCAGCGQVANDDDRTPWSYWANLPFRSAGAVLAGLVRPLTCPDCGGSGDAPSPRPAGRSESMSTTEKAPTHPTGAPHAMEEPRVEIIHMEADLDTVMRYYAQGYEMGDAELLDVQYAITPAHPRRVWLRLTIRHEEPNDHR